MEEMLLSLWVTGKLIGNSVEICWMACGAVNSKRAGPSTHSSSERGSYNTNSIIGRERGEARRVSFIKTIANTWLRVSLSLPLDPPHQPTAVRCPFKHYHFAVDIIIGWLAVGT